METGQESNIYRVNGLVRMISPKILDLTDVKALAEAAKGLPNDCYVEVDLYQHEQKTIFRDNWAAIGFGKDLSKPGCV